MATETIGQRLKRLRLERGLSQRELAVPGVSYAYISRIEAGTRSPSVKALRRLADGLGVSVEYLEAGTVETRTDTLAAELLVTSSIRIEAARERGEDGAWRLVAGPDSVALTWAYGDESRTVTGGSVTEVIGRALEWRLELDRLLELRSQIDSEIEERLAG